MRQTDTISINFAPQRRCGRRLPSALRYGCVLGLLWFCTCWLGAVNGQSVSYRMPTYHDKVPPPPMRTMDEVTRLLSGSRTVDATSDARLKVLLVAGPKDHGPGEHDYPAWQEVWSRLIDRHERTDVDTAFEFPTTKQLAWADVAMFYQRGRWDDKRQSAIDAYLQRGGGLIYLHWAVDGRGGQQQMAKRIGLAALGGNIRVRHGEMNIDFRPGAEHPILRNLERVRWLDESYWSLVGDAAQINLLGTSLEDGMPQPQFWTVEHGPGRVFVSILGHYMWTFDDPVFRTVLLRATAWAGHRPVDRFNQLVTLDARVTNDNAVRHVAHPSQRDVTAATVVGGCGLAHTRQILPHALDGTSVDQQVASVLLQCDRILSHFRAGRGDLVKLNVYVVSDADRQRFDDLLAQWCGDLPKPPIAYVETTLPDQARVALDGVIALPFEPPAEGVARQVRIKTIPAAHCSDTCVLSGGDVVYVAGQAAEGENLEIATRHTLHGLARTIDHLKLSKRQVVHVKCFLQPMGDLAVVTRQLASFFDNVVPPVSCVEWQSSSRPIEIELIVAAPASESDSRVSYLTPPWMKASPVFSRAARIHGNHRIYVSGLTSLESGDGASEVQSVFAQLNRILAATGSDVRHLAKATYYVSSDDASSQLNRLRPSIYDPARPPAASKAAVRGVAAHQRSLGIDIIAAPRDVE